MKLKTSDKIIAKLLFTTSSVFSLSIFVPFFAAQQQICQQNLLLFVIVSVHILLSSLTLTYIDLYKVDLACGKHRQINARVDLNSVTLIKRLPRRDKKPRLHFFDVRLNMCHNEYFIFSFA